MRVYTLVLSVLAHLVAVTALIVVPLVATDVLPEPRRALEYVQVMPAVIQPQPPPMRPRVQAMPRQVASEAAPIEAPQGVRPEVNVAPPDWFDLHQSTVDGVPLIGELVGDPLPPPPREVEPVRVGGLIVDPSGYGMWRRFTPSSRALRELRVP